MRSSPRSKRSHLPVVVVVVHRVGGVTDKPVVIAAGTDAAAARTAIGVGGLDTANSYSTTQTLATAF
ncbi:hypothetical protein [Rhodococcus sp. IEGM 1351]|uniref:hypothetical protein n=1 Tax=Rhodococcus sp. IEGM 1351 TaxID=3047089 RepID=UPI0024B6F0E5|nr:hypothetical protein [Rhodococcus sp. IEGM 1351]